MLHINFNQTMACPVTVSTKMMVWSLLLGYLLLPAKSAFTLEKVNVTLPSKSFQFVIFPIAKERGYMKEEGIDLNIVVMGSTAGIQAVLASDMHFTGSGSSASGCGDQRHREQ